MFYRSVTLALLLGAAGAQAESASKNISTNTEPKGWTPGSRLSTLIEGSAPVRPRRSEAGPAEERFEAILPSVTDDLADELERRFGAGIAAEVDGRTPAPPLRGDEVAAIR